jgi:hypothetical protein
MGEGAARFPMKGAHQATNRSAERAQRSCYPPSRTSATTTFGMPRQGADVVKCHGKALTS